MFAAVSFMCVSVCVCCASCRDWLDKIESCAVQRARDHLVDVDDDGGGDEKEEEEDIESIIAWHTHTHTQTHTQPPTRTLIGAWGSQSRDGSCKSVMMLGNGTMGDHGVIVNIQLSEEKVVAHLRKYQSKQTRAK